MHDIKTISYSISFAIKLKTFKMPFAPFLVLPIKKNWLSVKSILNSGSVGADDTALS